VVADANLITSTTTVSAGKRVIFFYTKRIQVAEEKIEESPSGWRRGRRKWKVEEEEEEEEEGVQQ
jgi:hypothetical protein